MVDELARNAQITISGGSRVELKLGRRPLSRARPGWEAAMGR